MFKLFLLFFAIQVWAITSLPMGFMSNTISPFPPTQISNTSPNIITSSRTIPVSSTAPAIAMTSYTAPAGYFASSSTEFSTAYGAWRAFDKAVPTDNWWISGSGTTSAWLKLQIPNAVVVNSYTISMSTDVNPDTPRTWTLEACNDDLNWIVLDSQTNIPVWGRPSSQTYNFVNYNAYKYYLLRITATNTDAQGSASFVGVSELALSGSNFTAVDPYKAFDSSDATGWSPGLPFTVGDWLKLELTTPVSVVKYKIKSQQITNPLGGCPTSFVLEGSNDNSIWTSIDTRAGITWNGALEEKEFNLLSISLPYKYLRLVINATSNGQPPYIVNLTFFKR